MKIKSTRARSHAPFILLTLFCVHSHLTLSNPDQEFVNNLAYSAYSDKETYQAKKFDQHQSLKKDVVFGDKLQIKDSGLICKNLRAESIFAHDQLSLNNKGCQSLLVTGAKEKNLLNLRSTFCFACPPSLSCSLNQTCESFDSSPTVGCLDISSSISQNDLNVCSGFGIAAKQATVFTSGTSCQSQLAIGANDISINVVNNVQVEICIPIFFCTKFCDRPTLQVTYEENACQTEASACVKNRIIPEGDNPSCPLSGNSVTTFLGASVHIQRVSCKDACIKFQLLYQNCIGIIVNSTSLSCSQELSREACNQQKLAIEDICKNANLILNTACFDVKVEGRVL